jgi:methylmalonyl-CoA mutase
MDVLTGASEFPNLREVQVAVEDVKPVPFTTPSEPIKFEPLAALRLAAPFELLRDRSDQILKSRGSRPSIFLANLGTPADFTPSATFARNFFEAGGIAVIDSGGSSDAGVLTAAWKTSGAALVCLCSSDRLYGQHAVDAAKALTAAGAKHIYLAGRPGEQEGALRESGVSDFVFAGADALLLLQQAHELVERT